MRVPDSIRVTLRVSVITCSLRTSNPREAGRRAQRLAWVCSGLFDDIREGAYRGMDDKEIRRLVTQWMNEALEDDERRRLTRPRPRTIDDVEVESEILTEAQAENMERLATDDYGKYAGLAEEILIDNGITLQKDDISFRKFCRELIKASISLHEEIKRRNDGMYQDEYDSRPLETQRLSALARGEAVNLSLADGENDGELSKSELLRCRRCLGEGQASTRRVDRTHQTRQ